MGEQSESIQIQIQITKHVMKYNLLKINSCFRFECLTPI